MNQYWIIALFFSYIVVGGIGVKYGADAVKVQCEKHNEEQQQHVIGQMQAQNKITQGVSNAYKTGIATIDDLYATASVQPANNGNIRRVSTAACGIETTKKYQLTQKQCDEEEAKCIALWDWTQQQAAVK